jgi:DNA primase large subunit
VCKAIIDTLKDKASLLDQWIEVHEAMFGASSRDIPPGESIHLSKLRDGVITTDTCNAARLLSSLVSEKVEEAVQIKISE